MMAVTEALKQAQSQGLLRLLDVKFAQMVAEGSTQPALTLAAAILSRDVGEGHVCLPLTQLQPDKFFSGRYLALAQTLWLAAGAPSNWSEVLLAEAAVSTGKKSTPLILHQQRLYLHRMWQSEGEVARFIQRPMLVQRFDETLIRKTLDRYFGQQPDDWQKIAAAVTLTRQVTVISGGPGTGKTTTIAKILASLIELSPSLPRINLAAPTGKAAARLTESLSKTLKRLALVNLVARNFPLKATTLHRLLGGVPNSQRMRYHAGNPLHLDVLVVDEASMVDLQMLVNLIAALPNKARVIFLGDCDQLASVEAGAVLGDICRYAEVGYSLERAAELTRLTGCHVVGNEDAAVSDVRDALCLLRKSYRFNEYSGIGRLALAVNAGKTATVHKIFTQNFSDIHRYPLTNSGDYQKLLNDSVAGYSNYLRALACRAATPSKILDEFSRFRVLCALREGPFGIIGLNEHIERALSMAGLIHLNIESHGKWYVGRPVMVARNDSTLELYNGDIGITIPDEQQQLKVFFPLPNGTIKSFQPSRLPPHDTAYAMTVHKSQGSEFTDIMLVLPNQMMPVLTRELVYTAITRAKRQLTLYADTLVFNSAVKMRIQRYSGLVERLTIPPGTLPRKDI